MRATLDTQLVAGHVSRVVYGSIIGLALIVALESHPPSAAVMIGWLLGTAVAVGLAELYSEIVGDVTRTRRRATHEQLRHMAGSATAVAIGVAFPAVFFLFPLLGIGTVETAFTVAKWSGLGLVGGFGFGAARLAGAPWHRAVLYAALLMGVDAVLIELKAFLH